MICNINRFVLQCGIAFIEPGNENNSQPDWWNRYFGQFDLLFCSFNYYLAKENKKLSVKCFIPVTTALFIWFFFFSFQAE